MEFEQATNNASWTILRALSKGEKSSAEIMRETGISLATISQQMKLLGAYGLVTLQKQSRSGPGKPRLLYSLGREFAHLSVLRRGFAQKRTMRLDDYRKTRLNLLFLERSDEQYFLEKFLWEREEHLVHCDAVALSDSDGHELHLLVVTDDAHLERIRKEMSSTVVKRLHERRDERKEERREERKEEKRDEKKDERKVICWTHTFAELRDGLARREEYYLKLVAHPHILVDRKGLIAGLVP